MSLFNMREKFRFITKLYNKKSTFVSPNYTSSLAGYIIVYTVIQRTNWEKYLNCIIYKGKKPTPGEVMTSPTISSFTDRVFSIFRPKITGPIVRNEHQSGFSRADTTNNSRNKRSYRFCFRGNYQKYIERNEIKKSTYKWWIRFTFTCGYCSIV